MMLLQPVAAHTGLRDGLILDPKTVIELKPSIDYDLDGLVYKVEAKMERYDHQRLENDH